MAFDYDGSSHIPAWTNNNASITVTGTTSAQTAIGNYSTTFTPDSNHAWTDGTTSGVTINWSISGTPISRVTGSPTSFAYDGSTHIPTWTNYNSSYITIGSTTSAQSAASTYTTTFTPKAGYYWSTGSAKDTITITWYIRRASVTAAPTAKTGLVYSGSAQALVNAGTTSNGTMNYKLDDGSYIFL